ncbi:hypothetical protein [Leptolyngbya sp. NIES-2104]|uniref:hypothetical protein n=1 Tax=Leptolyngbya sp. NIES-2104 TaxID=1552121 RepID=UPI0006EC9B40|nr:hypothetical protein [Leptolyngbya sp. NIES-2104]GAQ00060.1 hypothetical protein NIES2104_66250 [Leptolyngbya sp. NIES-2104]
MPQSLLKQTTVNLIHWSLPLAILWGGVAKAQVGLSPVIIQTTAKNGQAQTSLLVKNNGNELFRARIYVEPFTYNKELGFQTLPSSPSDLTPYLQFSPRELSIPAGIERRVSLVLRLPPSLPDGEYRAVIFTENLKESVFTGTDNQGSTFKSVVAARIGSTIFIRKGDVKPNLALASAQWNSKEKKIQLLIKNTGKASAYTDINWGVNQGGNILKAGVIPSIGIVPESERLISIKNTPDQKSIDLAPGKYQITGKLSWGEPNKKSEMPFSLELAIPAN